jgi:hypothetical protein
MHFTAIETFTPCRHRTDSCAVQNAEEEEGRRGKNEKQKQEKVEQRREREKG